MLYPPDNLRTIGRFPLGYADPYVDNALDNHTAMDVLIFARIQTPFAELHRDELDEDEHMLNLTVARINRAVRACWQTMKDKGINVNLLEFEDGRLDQLEIPDGPFGLRPQMGVDHKRTINNLNILRLGWIIVMYGDEETHDLGEDDIFGGHAKPRWYPFLRDAYCRVAGLTATFNANFQTESLQKCGQELTRLLPSC